MTRKLSRYVVHITLLVLLLGAFIYGLVAGSARMAYFFNGVLVNVFDPLVWLIALPFAVYIRRQALLLPALLVVAILLAVVKIKMSWLLGSVAGEVIGVVTVGYIVNAIVLVHRDKRETVGSPGG